MKIKKFWAFQISKKIIFEAKYYQLRGNEKPHFSTSASEFNQPKTDWKRCGQAQEALLPKSSNAYKFWEKWDKKHLQDLTDKEYNELLKDIDILKEKYNFIEQEQDENLYISHLPFYELRKLSMKKPKSKKTTSMKGLFFNMKELSRIRGTCAEALTKSEQVINNSELDKLSKLYLLESLQAYKQIINKIDGYKRGQ